MKLLFGAILGVALMADAPASDAPTILKPTITIGPLVLSTAPPTLLDPNGSSGMYVRCFSGGKPYVEWDDGVKAWAAKCRPPHGPFEYPHVDVPLSAP